MTKFCNKCKTHKELSEFHRCKSKKDGLSSNCKPCVLIANRKWDKENPEKLKAAKDNWIKENPVKRKGYKKNYHTKHPDRVRNTNRRQLLRRRGLTEVSFQYLKEKQSNRCAVCGSPPDNGKELCIDHDHVTGALRGLLCSKCNKAAGLLMDNSDTVRRLAEYLDNPPEKKGRA